MTARYCVYIRGYFGSSLCEERSSTKTSFPANVCQRVFDILGDALLVGVAALDGPDFAKSIFFLYKRCEKAPPES